MTNTLNKKEEEKRRELYETGLNDKEIAKKFGVTKEAIKEWRERRNLPQNYYYTRGNENRGKPSKKKVVEKIKNTSYSGWRDFFKEEFNASEGLYKDWLEDYNFPETTNGSYSILYVKMELLQEKIVNIAKEYTATVAAQELDLPLSSLKNFLTEKNIDHSKNGWKYKPKMKPMDALLSINGDWYKLENSGADYLVKKGNENCILIEEKSSIGHGNWERAVRQLMIAEKIIKEEFGLSTQRKIVYCENSKFESVQDSKLRRTNNFLGIEFWDWKNKEG